MLEKIQIQRSFSVNIEKNLKKSKLKHFLYFLMSQFAELI
jgi:hypothetical protein